jgi:hypothetical protein
MLDLHQDVKSAFESGGFACIFQDPCLSDLIFRINIYVSFKNKSQYLKVGEVVYPNIQKVL